MPESSIINISTQVFDSLLLQEQIVDPTTLVNQGVVFTKDNGGVTDLYFRQDNNGTVIQLTAAGGGVQWTDTGVYLYPTGGAGRNVAIGATAMLGAEKFRVVGDSVLEGSVLISGDLTVNGTQTIVNSTTVDFDLAQISPSTLTSPTGLFIAPDDEGGGGGTYTGDLLILQQRQSSVNTNVFSIDSTGNILGSGDVALGNASILSNDRVFDFSASITTFPTGQDYGTYSQINLNPSATVGTGSESFVAKEYILSTQSANVNDFNLANFSNVEMFFNHNGTGDIVNAISIWGGANNTSTGNVTFELVGGYFTSYNSGNGNINGLTPKSGNFALAAGTGNFGTGLIELNYTFYGESPYNTGGGIIRKNWGFYLEDQEIGAVDSWAIQTNGGKVEFGAITGKSSLLYLSNDDLAHGITDVVPTNVYSSLNSVSASAGGLILKGIATGGNSGVEIDSILHTPVAGIAAFTIIGSKKNGTNIQNLSTSDSLFSLINNSATTTPAIHFLGNGNAGMGTQSPTARLDIITQGVTNATQSLQVKETGTGTVIFKVRDDRRVTIGDPSLVGQNAMLNIAAKSNTSGVQGIINVKGFANTGITAGGENILFDLDIAQTLTWNAGNVPIQRFVYFRKPQINISGGASTVTTAATFAIQDEPGQLAGTTITNKRALLIEAGSAQFKGRVLETQGADIASAGDLVIGNDGNSFVVTGTTTINAINTSGLADGFVVRLCFVDNITLNHGTAGGAGTEFLLLAGSISFNATSGDQITLELKTVGGTRGWWEQARTVI